MLTAVKKALRLTPKGRKNTPHIEYTTQNPEEAIQRVLDNILKEAKTKWS
ncbi:MAG: hypothetical protein K6T31_11375 [Alicyclobacillus sp.]|nr:hypothetical protein [Alicyclobacillus sp.]